MFFLLFHNIINKKNILEREVFYMAISLNLTSIIVGLIILAGLILLFKVAKFVGKVISIIGLIILILVYVVPNLPFL